MIELKSILICAVQRAFVELYHLSLPEEACDLQPTRKEFQGNFSFPVFPHCKQCREQPSELAEKLGQWIQKHTDVVASYNVIGGFLNLTICDKVWLAILRDIVRNPTYGRLERKNSQVVIEFSCPNTNKPQHLGHLRNNFLGSALAALLDWAGHTVYKVNLINDRGIHICKSMVAYQRFGNNETPAHSGIKGDHLVGKYYVKFEQVCKEQQEAMKGEENKGGEVIPSILQEAHQMLLDWERGESFVRDLWRKMNEWVYEGFNKTYEQLGITFNKLYYESDTYLLGKIIVEEGIKKKIFYQRADGAIAVDLTQLGLGEKVLLRKDGTSVYITQDLGTADLRYADYSFDKMIYVVGDEQAYHFQVLFNIMARLGRPYAASMYHLPYGMVNLPTGKMKSREGNVVDADTLINEMLDTVKAYTPNSNKIEGLSSEELKKLYHVLAVGALKFFLLRVSPQKRILFNPIESIDFQGDTGTFVQYTYARIRSLERKAMQEILPVEQLSAPLSPLEQQLIFQLYMFPVYVHEAAQTYMPSVIANYALELAKIYNRFYAIHPVIRAPNGDKRAFRLFLSSCVGHVLKIAMKLLTIEMPEKM